ncbi:MAG: MBOAT family O-acyltransferase [Bacillota bacterium]|nr:MBOAT family O-acyltransferase [Bacillota bacterium]
MYKNVVLLLASIIFYAWGEPRLVIVMIAVALVAYGGGLLIDKYRSDKSKAKLIMIITVALIVANLFIFKYLNFAVDNLASLGLNISIGEIRLPIGISFYTFQILSYVIDLYRGSVKLQKNFFYLLLYLCFFPQLIAGPIVRYSTVEEEINNREEKFDEIIAGSKRFIIGLAKKVILANGIASFAEIVYAGTFEVYGTAMYWLAALAYTFQIYFDFSGYSDMAIGLGLITGFHFLENFEHPYIATSITEFWRRWHISLSTWFRDYVYIPLGGNRCSASRQIVNLLIVWALTGLWHGASWNFVLWGLYYFVLLIIEKFWGGKFLKSLPKIASWCITMFFVSLGWVIFNITDFTALQYALTSMFSSHKVEWLEMYMTNTGIASAAFYFIPCIICMFPVGKYVKKIEENDIGLALSNVWHLILLVISIIYIISSSYNPFIYFRF